MKPMIMMSGAILFAFAMNAGANTSITDYFPPERIHCLKTDSSYVHCEGFNHHVLTEDLRAATFDKKEDTFSYQSGVAYFTPDKSQATIFFTYKNSKQQVMRLKSVSVLLRPATGANSAWTQIQEDLFVCDSGYMHCPITDVDAS